MKFKNIIQRLMPANDALSWIDVKEKSEIMEAAKLKANMAIMEHFAATKEYDRFCKRYEDEIKAAKKY